MDQPGATTPEKQEHIGGTELGVELPDPLEHIVAHVFRLYQARSPDDLAALVRRHYREDAMFVDPTVAARPRSQLALQFYALQHLFSGVRVSDISPPRAALLPQPEGPSLLKVEVRSRQHYSFARSNHISQQILPEATTIEASTTLLLDPQTGAVVRHEDAWDNLPSLHLPMAWRRFNSLWSCGIYRLLGWARTMTEAEARCAAAEAAPKPGRGPG